MLQYMKKTRMNNPEIQVKDPRILELNEIVTEVKYSEEWEVVQKKGLSVSEIADLLEEREETIQKIINNLQKNN